LWFRNYRYLLCIRIRISKGVCIRIRLDFQQIPDSTEIFTLPPFLPMTFYIFIIASFNQSFYNVREVITVPITVT
jgi:membrane protein CcdC involved in cytochrome C biogenesis